MDLQKGHPADFRHFKAVFRMIQFHEQTELPSESMAEKAIEARIVSIQKWKANANRPPPFLW